MGRTTSHLSSPFLELSEVLGEGEGKSGLESLCVVAGKREEKGKINVFDVIGDWIQLQKYKCQLLHFSKEIFRAQRELMASGGSELEDCC